MRRGKEENQGTGTESHHLRGQSPKQIPILAPLLPHRHPVLTWILSVTINLTYILSGKALMVRKCSSSYLLT